MEKFAPPVKASILGSRSTYKPFDFSWAFDAYLKSEKMHWMVSELSFQPDIQDWKFKLTDDEKFLLTNIFRFFTQADCDIAEGYTSKYLRWFKLPELRMMLSSFAAREAIHIQAYATIIEEIGMPETEYSAFLECEAMKEKHDYLFQERGMFEDIAVISIFGEGLQLFSSFVMLLSFGRFGKMKTMCDVVAWSIRDETLHFESMIKVFRQLKKELPSDFKNAEPNITQIARSMVGIEDKFIELAYGSSVIDGVSQDEVKQYIRFTADKRLLQIGMNPIFNVKKNPLPWVDEVINAEPKVDFFKRRPTNYSKATGTGWDDMF